MRILPHAHLAFKGLAGRDFECVVVVTHLGILAEHGAIWQLRYSPQDGLETLRLDGDAIGFSLLHLDRVEGEVEFALELLDGLGAVLFFILLLLVLAIRLCSGLLFLGYNWCSLARLSGPRCLAVNQTHAGTDKGYRQHHRDGDLDLCNQHGFQHSFRQRDDLGRDGTGRQRLACRHQRGGLNCGNRQRPRHASRSHIPAQNRCQHAAGNHHAVARQPLGQQGSPSGQAA